MSDVNIETLLDRFQRATVNWWDYVSDEHKYLFPREGELLKKRDDAKRAIVEAFEMKKAKQEG